MSNTERFAYSLCQQIFKNAISKMMGGSSATLRDIRVVLADKYIEGVDIEIGTLHNNLINTSYKW